MLDMAIDRWITLDGATVAAALVLAGLVRGFSGFGAAMIFIPVAAAVWGPQAAVPMLLVIDGSMSAPLLVKAVRRCIWREVLPLALGMALMAPVGVSVLAVADPEVLRWAICGVVAIALLLLASGWRYVGRPALPATMAVGATAGFMGGSVGIAGPPVILFWLAGQSDMGAVRANIIVLFAISTVTQGLSLYANGLLTLGGAVTAAAAIPFYALAIFIGARCFRIASETLFRRLAYVLITAAAIAGLPIW